MNESPEVQNLHEAIETLAYAVEANAGVSGWLHVTDNAALERIRDCVLHMREARAALHQKARQLENERPAVPEDPAIATEPECCS